MVQEILTHRCQVLAAQALFLLQLVLSMSESTALLFLAVFAILSVQPEFAQLRLDLLFPAVLVLGSIFEG